MPGTSAIAASVVSWSERSTASDATSSPSRRIVSARRRGIPSSSGAISATRSGVGNAGDRADRLVEGRPEPLDEGAQLRTRSGDGDLLAEDRAQQELERIDGARDLDPRRSLHERNERRIQAEYGIDLDRVGVEVERRPR